MIKIIKKTCYVVLLALWFGMLGFTNHVYGEMVADNPVECHFVVRAGNICYNIAVLNEEKRLFALIVFQTFGTLLGIPLWFIAREPKENR